MTFGRAASRLLAACAALAAGGAALAQPAPPAPTVPSDETLYTDAMECKVRVEALVPLSKGKKERKRAEQILAYWTGQQRSAAAKLGKSAGDMMMDEVIFGLAEADRPDGYSRAQLCYRHGATALTM